MKFTLEIELGNDLMKDSADIGAALVRNGRKFIQGTDGPEIRDSGKIKDINGNIVGKWEVTETPIELPLMDPRRCEDCLHAIHANNCTHCESGTMCNPYALSSTEQGWRKLA
jgi:hypothetical protein